MQVSGSFKFPFQPCVGHLEKETVQKVHCRRFRSTQVETTRSALRFTERTCSHSHRAQVEGGASIEEASAEAVQQVIDEVLEEGGSAAEVEEARAVATAVAEALVDGVPGEQTVAVAQEVAVEMAQATEDANLESEEGAAAGELASVLAAVEDGMDPAVAEGLEAAVLEDVANIVQEKVSCLGTSGPGVLLEVQQAKDLGALCPFLSTVLTHRLPPPCMLTTLGAACLIHSLSGVIIRCRQ